jgi:hypothetical protein
VYDGSAVYVRHAEDYLFEDVFGVGLFESTLPLDQLKQISAARILHNDKQMLFAFEHLQQPNHVGMLNLLEQVYLLKHFPLAEFILHKRFLYRLNGYLLAG